MLLIYTSKDTSSPSKVEIRETAWREAPYYGHAPPMMYRLVTHECDTASLFERYRDDCSKCPWGAIDKKVLISGDRPHA